MLTILLFDSVIALLMFGLPMLAAWLWRRKWVYGRPDWLALATVAAAALWLIVFYGSFIEPRFLTVREYAVRIGGGERQVKIAAISDTHLGGYRDAYWLQKVVARVNAQRPDVVLVLGDIATTATGLEEMSPFRDLAAPLGVYAVLGNWDYRVGGVDVRRRIESYGVEVLTNENLPLGPVAGSPVLVGLDDYDYGTPDWNKALEGVAADAPKILAVHNPDFTPIAEVRGLDLVMAGHTHCGQIRLPLIGPLPPMPTKIGRRFDCGLFDYGRTKLFITRGVGESGPRARLFNVAEVSVVNVSY